jgi:crossover junction endodeoxyribonuclease RuvC
MQLSEKNKNMGKYIMSREDNVYIGIDPGKSGAIAVIEHDGVFIQDMPLFAGKEINARAINNYFVYLFSLFLKENIVCCLEKSQPMPGQGVTSVFNYGKGYGIILSCLDMNEISYQEVHPRKNKKTKKDSVEKAIKLFPEQEDKFMTPRGRLLDGRAEALLMAEYARRNF